MRKLNKTKTIIISIIIIFIIGIYYFSIKEKDYIESDTNFSISNKTENDTNKEESESKDTKEKIIIYIAGAIKNEGVYELDENSRIADCIEKAGGLTEDANLQDINLAYMLEDGMKIYIPKNSESNNHNNTESNATTENDKREVTVKNIENKNSKTQNVKININTATQTELETLPGIGSSTALKIINYRKENGKFKSIEDIKNVNGIGDSKYNKIKDMIKI